MGRCGALRSAVEAWLIHDAVDKSMRYLDVSDGIRCLSATPLSGFTGDGPACASKDEQKALGVRYGSWALRFAAHCMLGLFDHQAARRCEQGRPAHGCARGSDDGTPATPPPGPAR